MNKVDKVIGELEDEISVLNRSIDKLEFDSPVTLRSVIFGDKYDKELERMKVSKYTLRYVIKKLEKEVKE